MSTLFCLFLGFLVLQPCTCSNAEPPVLSEEIKQRSNKCQKGLLSFLSPGKMPPTKQVETPAALDWLLSDLVRSPLPQIKFTFYISPLPPSLHRAFRSVLS